MKIRFFKCLLAILSHLLFIVTSHAADDVLPYGQTTENEIAEESLGFLAPDFVEQFIWTVVNRGHISFVGRPKSAGAAEVFSVQVDPDKKTLHLFLADVPSEYAELQVSFNIARMNENQFINDVYENLGSGDSPQWAMNVRLPEEVIIARILRDEFAHLGYGRVNYLNLLRSYPQGYMADLYRAGQLHFTLGTSEFIRAHLLPEAVPTRYKESPSNSTSIVAASGGAALSCAGDIFSDEHTQVGPAQNPYMTQTHLMSVEFRGSELLQGQNLASSIISALNSGRSLALTGK